MKTYILVMMSCLVSAIVCAILFNFQGTPKGQRGKRFKLNGFKLLKEVSFSIAIICAACFMTGGCFWLPGVICGWNPETKMPDCSGKYIVLLVVFLPIAMCFLMSVSCACEDSIKNLKEVVAVVPSQPPIEINNESFVPAFVEREIEIPDPIHNRYEILDL